MKKFIMSLFISIILIGYFRNNFWQKYQQQLIPMPKEIHEFGKFPFLDELDMLTWMTAPMVVMYDKEGKVKSVQTYIYDKEGGSRGYYSTYNKGNFERGYMYGCEEHGQPIEAWPE